MQKDGLLLLVLDINKAYGTIIAVMAIVCILTFLIDLRFGMQQRRMIGVEKIQLSTVSTLNSLAAPGSSSE